MTTLSTLASIVASGGQARVTLRRDLAVGGVTVSAGSPITGSPQDIRPGPPPAPTVVFLVGAETFYMAASQIATAEAV